MDCDGMEETERRRRRRSLLNKTWDRCKSFGGRKRGPRPPSMMPKKSKSWPRLVDRSRVVPQGCFTVYVGPEKQRFVVKTEHANHPLFKMLLEEAESEYGYSCQGPLLLPCEVDYFYRVLMEIDGDDHEEGDDDDDQFHNHHGCGFAAASYQLLSPSHLTLKSST